MKVCEKDEIYRTCLEEIKESMQRAKEIHEKMALVCRILKAKLPHYLWVGFYIPKDNYLELGPSEGPPACAQIAYTGVCGKCAKSGETILVPNVLEFPGHITCDPRSKSEIAVPVRNRKGEVIAVLDVDSSEFGDLDEKDKEWLEKIVEILVSPERRR